MTPAPDDRWRSQLSPPLGTRAPYAGWIGRRGSIRLSSVLSGV